MSIRRQAEELRKPPPLRQELQRKIEKRIMTTLIGSLARFEEAFGVAWGHNLSDQPLTELQKKWLEVWLECRSKILDHGNAQIRAAIQELGLWDIYWRA